MKDNNQARTISILAGLVCTIVLQAGAVSAQMDPGSGTRPQQTSSTPDSRSRTRRPNGAPEEKSAKEATDETRSKSSTDATITAIATPEADSKQPKTASANLADLRAQIDAATTPQEKNSLRVKLVEQLVAADKKPEALSELHSMAAEDCFDPQGFYNIGNALARLRDSEGAIGAYRKAIDQRKGKYSKALNNLAVLLMRQGNWQEANDALTTALRLESFHYAEASYNLGRLYAAQGQMDLAIREWRRALKVDPEHRAAAQALARASSDDQVTVTPKGDKLETIRTGTTAEPKAGFSNSNAAVTARTFSTSRTKTLTVDQVTYNQLQRARSAHERGKDAEAVTSYRYVISRMGGYFGPANLELSYVLIGMKQPAEALNYLQDVTVKDGDRYPISYYHLGRLYEFNGDLERANEAYAQAAAHFQGINPQFLLDVSRVSEKRGDYKQALAAMEEYLTTVEGRGSRPAWSEERLASLRQKVAEKK